MKPAELTIRAWEQDDFARLAASAPLLSSRTLQLRFWTGMPTLPTSYLRSTAQRWPANWDAVVALDGELLVGWAEFGRNRDAPQTADVGVCVIDAEQGHGIGSALLRALLERARRAGLVSLHADIDPANLLAQSAWRRVTGAAAPNYALAG